MSLPGVIVGALAGAAVGAVTQSTPWRPRSAQRRFRRSKHHSAELEWAAFGAILGALFG